MRTPTIADEAAAAGVLAGDIAHIHAAAASELEAMRGRHVLLTGGGGFLGYELVHALLAYNVDRPPASPIRLTILDNFIRGMPEWLADLDAQNVTIREHDVSRDLPSDIGAVDYVIHAAGIASPTYYRLHPIETMDANVGGLRRLLDHCIEQGRSAAGVSGFLFFSSSEIYGDPPADEIPTRETYRGNVSSTGPRACYDESKRFGETLCVNFARQHGLPVTIARPFNNYGPGLKITDGRVVPDLARDVLEERDIVLLSDGSPTRTFCYVADAVSGYIKVLVRGRAGEAYNIGVEHPEVSILDLASRLRDQANELFGYEGNVVHGRSDEADYLVDNPNRRSPIIAKAATDVGFAPTIDLDEGLRRSLLWYAGNASGTSA